MNNIKKELVASYEATHDRTIIFEECYDANDNHISSEVVGWYYGEPEEKLTNEYTGQLRATYED